MNFDDLTKGPIIGTGYKPMDPMRAKQIEMCILGLPPCDLERVIVLVVGELVKSTPNGRRLGMRQFPGITFAFGVGKEWSAKIAAIYQAWLADEVGSVPKELQMDWLSNLAVKQFFDSFSKEQCEVIGKYLTEKATKEWPSTYHPSDRVTQRLSSLAKLREQKKNEEANPSSAAADSSSTKCSPDKESTGESAT
jgi:hypothetical protein